MNKRVLLIPVLAIVTLAASLLLLIFDLQGWIGLQIMTWGIVLNHIVLSVNGNKMPSLGLSDLHVLRCSTHIPLVKFHKYKVLSDIIPIPTFNHGSLHISLGDLVVISGVIYLGFEVL